MIYIINKNVEQYNYNCNKYSLSIAFLRDINEGHLSLENADDDQSNFAAKLKSLDEGKNTIEKGFF